MKNKPLKQDFKPTPTLAFITFFLLIVISGAQTESIDANTAGQTHDASLTDPRNLAHVRNVTEVAPRPHQLSCLSNSTICNDVCNEHTRLPYSSTFCDPISGSCLCDCRDRIPSSCAQTPFTPCFQDCVTKNPNPDVFLYKGGNCAIPQTNGTVAYQCACECTFRDDYDETNDIV